MSKEKDLNTKKKMREILDQYYTDREYAENHYSAGDSPLTIAQVRDQALAQLEALMPREHKDDFYHTITHNPQWELWKKEQAKRLKDLSQNKKVEGGVYDMPEVMECGIISQKHFQEFIKFCMPREVSVGEIAKRIYDWHCNDEGSTGLEENTKELAQAIHDKIYSKEDSNCYHNPNKTA